ncbi:hypothetical protein [Marinicauda sp. Alg238-R41]|uniref:hypothetical protein n=1 Tax=Marinicauda sp. Alg238-R41 TaxID=2993447 RepID=UPI0022E85B85|nr:hypothetical protein [Marinicauda sp. Alg238-R41]
MADRNSRPTPANPGPDGENASMDNPADNQVEAEVFDEDKHLDRTDQRRPFDSDPGAAKVPVDQAIDGGRGERFGEQLPQTEEMSDPLEEAEMTEKRLSEENQSGKREDEKKKKSQSDKDENKVDEAMKESFPASDSPSFTPGGGG